MDELPTAPAPAHARRSALPMRLGLILLALALFGCDHATKVAAQASLSQGRTVDLVSGVLELRFAPNHDVAFSLLRNFKITPMPGVLLAVGAVAIVAVAALWIASRRRASRAQHVGFALILAGALGNVVDRAMHGYVVDFIHLTRWPVSNVADIAVVAGALLLGLAALSSRTTQDQRAS